MNPAELSRLILGSIILKPALLDSDDFDSSLFSSPRERRTFGLISQLYEDGRPTSIDPVILASRLGGDGGRILSARSWPAFIASPRNHFKFI